MRPLTFPCRSWLLVPLLLACGCNNDPKPSETKATSAPAAASATAVPTPAAPATPGLPKLTVEAVDAMDPLAVCKEVCVFRKVCGTGREGMEAPPVDQCQSGCADSVKRIPADHMLALRPCLLETDCEAYKGCAFTARERAGIRAR